MVVGGTVSVVLWLPIIGILVMREMGPSTGWDEALVLSAGGVALAALVLGWMLWRVLVRPITELRDRAAGLQAGRADALDPLPHYGTSEMRDLGQTFLDMGHTMRGREDVLRSYADHATHELRSPITVVQGAAELLASSGLPDDERARLIAKIDAAAERMTALLEAQRTLAQAQEPAAPGSCRVSEVAEGIDVVRDGEVALPPEVCAMVLSHLADNARAHGAERVTVTVESDRMIVGDDGPGVSIGNRDRIFEPFFTTRRDSGGTGMGLAIVRRLLQAHGATIALLPSERGAVFEICF
ncbi:MAG: ATP-binding protein [Pseudomonadota bacterium]